MKPLLVVDSISKRYVTYGSAWGRAASWFGWPTRVNDEYWALRDISFSVKPGEAVGVIGENGAGKSTLLKLVTGTVTPSAGAIHKAGSVAAVLELGLGFQPEATGRENVRQTAGMLGFTHSEISAVEGAIQDFSELDSFFDKPIRVYSSGMIARLAFALVTARRPDLLIVDEVLSVGDAYFQHKSFARIRQFRDAGTSILFVTHSLADVRELCDRAILLEKGTLLRDGPPDEVIDLYNALVARRGRTELTVEQRRAANGWSVTRSGDFRAKVERVCVLNQHGTETEEVEVGEAITIEIAAAAETDLDKLVLGVLLRDRTGHVVWGTNTWHTRQVVNDVKAGERFVFQFSMRCDLGPGSYSISPALVNSDTHLDANYEWTDNFHVFQVTNVRHNFFIGTSHLDATVAIERTTLP